MNDIFLFEKKGLGPTGKVRGTVPLNRHHAPLLREAACSRHRSASLAHRPLPRDRITGHGCYHPRVLRHDRSQLRDVGLCHAANARAEGSRQAPDSPQGCAWSGGGRSRRPAACVERAGLLCLARTARQALPLFGDAAVAHPPIRHRHHLGQAADLQRRRGSCRDGYHGHLHQQTLDRGPRRLACPVPPDLLSQVSPRAGASPPSTLALQMRST